MGTVDVELHEGVAVITLSAPDTRNALSVEMSETLFQLCDEIDADLDIGAVVIRGAGGTFCSGAERGVLSSAGTDPSLDENYRALGAVYQAFFRVGHLQAPTIAAVRGAAVGAGVNLMLSADLRLVAQDARIIGGFSQIGLHPGGGHFCLLGRLGGREAAAAMGVFGLEVSGIRAVELGLAWESLSDEEVEQRALDIADRASADPQLSRRVVQSMRDELGPPASPWSVAVEYERGSQMWSLRRSN